MKEPWRIELLGGLRLSRGNETVQRFRTQRSAALMAYLAYHAGRAHPREVLAEILWPETDADLARHNLRQALLLLRRQLEPPGDPPGSVVSADRFAVSLDASAVVTDVGVFLRALQRAKEAQSEGQQVALLTEALDVYRGELLPGCYEEWISPEREHLAERFLGAARDLVALLEGAGDLQRALECCCRALTADPLCEELRRAQMRLLAATGRPEAALREYQKLERELKRELGTSPCAATRDALRAVTRLATAQAGHPAPQDLYRAPAGPGADNVAARPLRIALLYSHGAQPDEQLLGHLETALRGRGHDVFVDRDVPIGIEWAKEVEHRVRTSDAVIPLLSAASVQSEMLAHELRAAHEFAQRQGRPLLLPVRVAYTGALPEALAGILQPLQQAHWRSPEDTDRLLRDLARALRLPLAPEPLAPWADLEPVGGAVPLDSRFYVVRHTDDEFHRAILRRDSVVLVKGPYQIGKTSLLARSLQQARDLGARVVLTDLQKLGGSHFGSVGDFLRAVAEWLADQLDLGTPPGECWQPGLSPSVNFERYLRRYVVGSAETPVVWGLDEVDRLFPCPFSVDVFGLFRSWHNERALAPDSPWRRLTLVIAHATEAHLHIRDPNRSPFNVGTRLELEDLLLAHVADLNRRYGCPLRRSADVDRYHDLVGGNPYLVRRGLHEMAARGTSLPSLEAQADRDEGVFGDHLRRILTQVAGDESLCAAARDLLRGRSQCPPESYYRLRSAGILAGDAPEEARFRCRLYAAYLKRHLL